MDLAKALLLFLTTVALAGVLSAQQPTAPPSAPCFVDEAPKDPTLVSFRDRLLAVVRARDLTALRPLIAPDVLNEDHNRGIFAFEKFNRLSRSPDGWMELESILKLPGTFWTPDTFCMPWFLCGHGAGEGDAMVVERSVPIMSEPRTGGTILRRASCEAFPASAESSRPPVPPYAPGWTRVFLETRRWGYIEDRYIDWECLSIEIQKRDGRWQLTVFSGCD